MVIYRGFVGIFVSVTMSRAFFFGSSREDVSNHGGADDECDLEFKAN